MRARGRPPAGRSPAPGLPDGAPPPTQFLNYHPRILPRKRGCHRKRDWYPRSASLRKRAVPPPRATLAGRPRSDLPSYLELEGCERICRWLDAQPKRRARLPFVGLTAQVDAENE